MISPSEYHERTKHHLHRYAASLGYLDWDSQPNPFRSYDGARPFDLPLISTPSPKLYRDLYTGDIGSAGPVTRGAIATILELSLGLSAWKSYEGSRWALRMNPSSGNLHPTEAHLITADLSDLPAGVYHYLPLLHRLELRREIPAAASASLAALPPGGGFFLLLNSIHWREAWKYGERAFRYCQHDVGHAIAAVAFAARLLGWRCSIVPELDDAGLARLAGFDKVVWPELDYETPDLLLCIHRLPRVGGLEFPASLLDAIATLPVDGKPNALGESHVDWDVIEEVATATRRLNAPMPSYLPPARPFINTPSRFDSGEAVIRARRSAQAFDPRGRMARDAFMAILDSTLPRRDAAPFDLGALPPEIDLFLFVHTVDDLPPGLYCLIRDPAHLEPLRRSTKSDHLWKPVSGPLPLYLLHEDDFRQEAAAVSCQQEIAGDSCFSLGMIARFHGAISEKPFRYRHLFWEAGVVGQALYLAAQAHGLMGTGIGCYFDDPVHDSIGLISGNYQSMYHFTIGVPLIDIRLNTEAPYAHLHRA